MEYRSLLFVGERNAARSIMAETCFNSAAFNGWRAFSAGWRTQRAIDPMTLYALQSQGFPTDALYSKSVDIFRQAGAPAIDFCVFLDEIPPPDAADYPGLAEHWRIANPRHARNEHAAYHQALAAVTAKISDLILCGRLLTVPDLFREAI